MNIKFKNIFLIIALLSLSISCSKDVVLPDDNIEDTIAIVGYILSEKDTVRVNVTKINTLGEKILNADVKLYGNDSVYTFHYSNYQKKYISDKKIKGEVGQAYTLEVIHNEKRYTATDTMPQYPSDEYNLPFYINEGRLACNYYNFGFQNTNEWYYSTIERNYEGIICAYNPKFTIKGNVPQGYTGYVTSIPIPDTLLINKCGLSEAYIKHKIEVLNVMVWNDNIFSIQPDNVSTNVTRGGYGFFAAKSVIHKRVPFDELLIVEK